MPTGQNLLRDVAEHTETCRIKYRIAIAEPDNRSLTDNRTRQRSRGLEADADDGTPYTALQPTKLEMLDRTDKSDFFATREQPQERCTRAAAYQFACGFENCKHTDQVIGGLGVNPFAVAPYGLAKAKAAEQSKGIQSAKVRIVDANLDVGHRVAGLVDLRSRYLCAADITRCVGEPEVGTAQMLDRRTAMPARRKMPRAKPAQTVKARMIHMRDEHAQWFLRPRRHQLAVVHAIARTDDDVTDGIDKTRDTRTITDGQQVVDDSLFTKRRCRNFQNALETT
jgi:hypothetical protein